MSLASPSSSAKASDFTRRTLRAWAVFEVLYGVAMILLISLYLPWKSPVYSGALVAYGAVHIAAAPGLWNIRPWGWRLALAGGLAGLLAAVLVVTGLVSAWAYLRAIYGDFGRGASIGALLFASVAVQVLGLYPALLVRTLLRREVRADVGASRHWLKVLVGMGLVPLLVPIWVSSHFAMPTRPTVEPSARATSIVYLRAVVDGHTTLPDLHALERIPAGAGPLFVTLWEKGEIALRVSGEGETLADAVRDAGENLAIEPLLLRTRLPGQGRLKVDRVVGVAPVLSEHAAVVALSIDPGRDGVQRGAAIMLPDDIVKRQLFGAAPLVPGIKEIRLGIFAKAIFAELGAEGSDPLERVRTEQWVEFEGETLGVSRSNTPARSEGREAWPHAPWAMPPDGEPDSDMVEIYRRYVQLHHDLVPLIDAFAHGPARRGLPVARALIFDYPEDSRVRDLWDQFLFGRDLLVAPVLRSGQRERDVYLPAGRWESFWDPTEQHVGPKKLSVEAPLGRIPVFVREGALVPGRARARADATTAP